LLGVAVLLVVAASSVSMPWHSNHPTWRGAALFGGIALGVVVALVSAPGKDFIGFSRNRIAKSASRLAHPQGSRADDGPGVCLCRDHGRVLWSADKLIEWVIFSLVLGWK